MQTADRRDEMSEGSYRMISGRLVWRIAVAVLALPLLAALALGEKVYVYMVQEVLVGMLVIVISLAAVLLLRITFIIFQEGMRRFVLWMKTGILQLAKWSYRQASRPNTV